MEKPDKKIILVAFIALVLLCVSQVAKASIRSTGKDIDLRRLLEDRIFSAFSLGGDYSRMELFGMCDGELIRGCYVSDEYGWRIHPFWRHRHFHSGIDLAAPIGAEIFAAADGIVRISEWQRGYGRFVEIDHGFAWSTRYAHMSKLLVKEGQLVKKGEVIGLVGFSGVSTGPHLHFEMVYLGKIVNPRNHFASLSSIGTSSYAFGNR